MAHLIYQTAFIGDLLLTAPLIREFRALYPKERLVLACRKGAGSIYLERGWVDELIEIDKGDRQSLKAFEKKLLSQSYDIVVCTHQSFRTHLLMSRVRAQKKIGYATWWNFFVFDERVARPMQLPEVFRLLALLAPLSPVWRTRLKEIGADSRHHNSEAQQSLHFWDVEIPLWASMKMDAQKEGARPAENATTRQIFISPGSVWATKKWTEAGFAELARRLLNAGDEVTLTGSPAENEVCARIEKLVGDARLKNICGQTSLIEMVRLFENAKWVIANDSSPIHLAALAGAPTIAIFGPTTLSLGYRPWNDRARVAQIALPCRPCGAHGHNVCPIGTHACMRDLKVDEVLALMNQQPNYF